MHLWQRVDLLHDDGSVPLRHDRRARCDAVVAEDGRRLSRQDLDQSLLLQPVDFYDIDNGNIEGTFVNSRPISFPSLFNQQYTDNRYLSAYSNIVYAFRNRYSLTGSMRIDQSNLFGTNLPLAASIPSRIC